MTSAAEHEGRVQGPERILGVERLSDSLPVFRVQLRDGCALYAPGHVAVVRDEDADEVARCLVGEGEVAPVNVRLATGLAEHARAAVKAWHDLAERPFVPECLTVYLSNSCSLGCTYCWAGPARQPSERRREVGRVVSEEAVSSAARVVARACSEIDRPLRLVIHGGGEPTAHWKLLQSIVAGTKKVAAEVDTEWWGHIATNGVVSESGAHYLADTFDSISLSCDGPPEIHDAQRPGADGGATSATVRRTAALLLAAGKPPAVRTTITPDSMSRQREIVEYLIGEIGAASIRFEPAYGLAGHNRALFAPHDADVFAAEFLAAQALAARRGARLELSRVRIDEVHGPYCDVLRGVLHLLPDDSATACFFALSGDGPFGGSRNVGTYSTAERQFALDHERIAALRHRATLIPPPCQECVAVLHCARRCPEVCVAHGKESEAIGPDDFLCSLSRRLAEAWIVRAADSLRPSPPTALVQMRPDDEELTKLTSGLPSSVDVEQIRAAWSSIRPLLFSRRRGPPAPVWAERGYDVSGVKTWKMVRQEVRSRASCGPLSLYVHIPFCRRRCPFCDCYAIPTGSGSGSLEAHFGDALGREIDSWAALEGLEHRPVTTIHFGGGTPNQLSPDLLARIVAGLRGSFVTTRDTEWALESTSGLLTSGHLDWLAALGFRRLHVGVQTLDGDVRRALGRRGKAADVLARIGSALSAGFVTSVDLIYGLPGQTLAGFANDIDQLVAAGVHGFSLYQLQATPKNRRFAERFSLAKRSPVENWLYFQIGEQLLAEANYRKNHFSHFAKDQDRNLYYTHAVRREDLLALGPTADGVFGRLSYRHSELDDYLVGSGEAGPGLEGMVRLKEDETDTAFALALLMTGRMSVDALTCIGQGNLLDRWSASGLITADRDPGCYKLTANGSWLIGEMIDQLMTSGDPRPTP